MIMLSFVPCLCIYSCIYSCLCIYSCIYSCLCTTSYDVDETFCDCVGTSLCTSGSLVFVFVFVFALYFVFAFVSQNPFAFVLGHWDKPVHQWVLGGASISIHILHRASHQGHLRHNGEMKLFSSPK